MAHSRSHAEKRIVSTQTKHPKRSPRPDFAALQRGSNDILHDEPECPENWVHCDYEGGPSLD